MRCCMRRAGSSPIHRASGTSGSARASSSCAVPRRCWHGGSPAAWPGVSSNPTPTARNEPARRHASLVPDFTPIVAMSTSAPLPLHTPPLRPEDSIPRPTTDAPPIALEPPESGRVPPALVRGRRLRVLQGTYEIAGQGMVLAHGLREAGCEARAFAYQVAWDGRKSDIIVDLDRRRTTLGRGLAMAGAFLRWAPEFDVFHLHFGTSFLPRRLDVPLLRAMGKKVVFHFHGCEVRNRSSMLGSPRLATCTECEPSCRPAQPPRLLQHIVRQPEPAVL